MAGEPKGKKDSQKDQRRTVKGEDAGGCQGEEEGLPAPEGGKKKG